MSMGGAIGAITAGRLKDRIASCVLLNPVGRIHEDLNHIVSSKSKTVSGKLSIYEANLEPTLRFIHATDIDACGWVKVPAGAWELSNESSSTGSDSESNDSSIIETTIIHAECDDFNDITPLREKAQEVAPILIASFDIECDSSHGDFPLANKRWEREVLIMSITPSMTPSSAMVAFREALYGKEADK